jgi:hypothetical protein
MNFILISARPSAFHLKISQLLTDIKNVIVLHRSPKSPRQDECKGQAPPKVFQKTMLVLLTMMKSSSSVHFEKL